MAEHERREAITILMVEDALEANNRDIAEATTHLLDAVGTLIVHASLHNGSDAVASLRACVGYLGSQVDRYLGEAK